MDAAEPLYPWKVFYWDEEGYVNEDVKGGGG